MSFHYTWNETHATHYGHQPCMCPSYAVDHSATPTMPSLLVFNLWQLLCFLLPQGLCPICFNCSHFWSSPSYIWFILEVLSEWYIIREPFPQPHRASRTRSGPSVIHSKHSLGDFHIFTIKSQENNCLLDYIISSFLVGHSFIRAIAPAALFTTAFPVPGPAHNIE